LSGIEITSRLLRCVQSWLRPFQRSAGGGGLVELLRPEHPGQRLPQDERLVRGRAGRRQGRVERIRLGLARGHHRVEVVAEAAVRVAEAKLDDAALAGPDFEPVVEGGLRPVQLRVDGRRPAEHVIGDPVLGVGRCGLAAEDALRVRLVLAEERLRRAARREPAAAEVVVLGEDRRAFEPHGGAPIIEPP
jgi:hypothetical protein